MIGIAPRHGRFMAAFGIGVVVVGVAWVQELPLVYSLISGLNVFFSLYIGLMAVLARAATPAELRRHASQDDEGVVLILLLALLAILASVAAIFLVLNAEGTSLQARMAALISLPLGWITVQMLAAFHYAHLHFSSCHPGMVFAGKGEPDAWDFLYASFTIGMTAQVSDYTVETRPMRRAVLIHAVASFFYNTCILALAVNAAVTAGL